MLKDKYILGIFLIFIILFMSYWNTHRSDWNDEKNIENFTSYYNTLYNSTSRNCRYLNRDIKKYVGNNVSGFKNYLTGRKKK